MKYSEDFEFEQLEKRINRDFSKIFKTEDKPVAWRKNVGGTWHYFDKSSPFPIDDCEPLYLRSEK